MATTETGFGFFAGGNLAAGELLGSAVYPFDMLFPGTSWASEIKSEFPATSTAVFTMVNTSTSAVVGTITFSAGSATGVVAWSPTSPYTLPATQRLWIFMRHLCPIRTVAYVTGLIQGTPVA